MSFKNCVNKWHVHQHYANALCGTLCVGRAQVTAVIHSLRLLFTDCRNRRVSFLYTASNSHDTMWGVTLLENISVAAIEILNSRVKAARSSVLCALHHIGILSDHCNYWNVALCSFRAYLLPAAVFLWSDKKRRLLCDNESNLDMLLTMRGSTFNINLMFQPKKHHTKI